VVREDASLPYHKRVKLSSTEAMLTLPLSARSGVSQVAPGSGVSPHTGISDSLLASSEHLPTTSAAVSHEVAESGDLWDTSDTAESEAFWGCPKTRTICPRTGTSLADTDERRNSELVASITDRTGEQNVIPCRTIQNIRDRVAETSEHNVCRTTATQTTCDNAEWQTFSKHDDSISTETRASSTSNDIDCISTQERSDTATEAESVTPGNQPVDADSVMDLSTSNDNINRASNTINTNTSDCLSISTQDYSDKVVTHSAMEAESVTPDNQLLNTDNMMSLTSDDNIDTDNSDSNTRACNTISCVSISTQDCSDKVITHSATEADNQLVDADSMMSLTSDTYIRYVNDSESIDELCVVNDPEADTYVVDDTDDSDVDDEFIACQPTWQTALKRDPYPVNESLLLTLEEVTNFTGLK